MIEAMHRRAETPPSDASLPGDDVSLPAWIYRDPEFYAVEQEALFRTSWQVVCHLNDIPEAGDFHTFEFLGENVVVLRGRDGVVRAFHNVCRHRAARLLDGPKGQCGSRIVCPYHAWTYEHDGRLIGMPQRSSYGDFDFGSHGLVPVEHEVFCGFIFIRLAPGTPSVAEMMGGYGEEMAAYRIEEMVPLGRVTLRPRSVNWKNVADNYSDGLHITVAHPGLTRLFGRGYGVEARPWVDKMWGQLQERPSAVLSERAYQHFLPEVPHLPPERQRLWTYFKLWPNIAFDIYPDQIDFMQFIPVSPTETMIREIAYVHPDHRPEMKAARYLNWRINRSVSLEDKTLIDRVQAGMGSSSYTVGPLGTTEVCLRSFARAMRRLIPESRLHRPPPAGWSLRREASQAPAFAAE